MVPGSIPNIILSFDNTIRLKANLVKYYNLLIRLAIIIGTLAFLFYQVFVKKDFVGMFGELSEITSNWEFYVLFILVLVMMPLNWGIEAWKWKFLVSKSEEVRLLVAMKAVYAGISISSLSPNRVGEFFGRVFVLKKTSFWKGVVMTVLGSYAQTFVTLIFGFNALALFSFTYLIDREIVNEFQFYFIYILIILVLFLFFVSFLWIAKFKFLWSKLKPKYRVAFSVLNTYRPRELFKVFLYSALRYFVFSLQYYLLLRALQVEVDFFTGMGLISLIFFLNTVRPSIALLEIGVRYAIAYQVFILFYEYGSVDIYFTEAQVLLASSILWLVNIVIPALIGLVFVKELRFVQSQRGIKS